MRRFNRVMLGGTLVVGSALLTGGHAAAAPPTAAGAAAAAVPAAYGFAFADQENATGSYPPNPRTSTNSTGATNLVVPAGTGSYEVRMPGLGAGANRGNVQVTAFGTNANRCKVGSWLPAPDQTTLIITVRCVNAAGQPANTKFMAQFHRGSNNESHQSAYVLSSATGSAPAAFQYNSRGNTNTVTQLGTGRYRVTFGAGFTRDSGIVNVTAHGTGTEFCTVESRSADNAVVRCFSNSGALVNAAWSLRYHDQHLPNGFAELGGYALSNRPSTDAPYPADPATSFNMLGQTNTIDRTAVGRYRVSFPRIPAFDEGNAMASAYGTSPRHCKVANLLSSGSGSVVDLACFNQSGSPADSAAAATQVTNQ